MNENLFKASVRSHLKTEDKNISDTQQKKVKLQDTSFGIDTLESYELRRYSALKKEIIDSRKQLKIFFSFFSSFILSAIFILSFFIIRMYHETLNYSRAENFASRTVSLDKDIQMLNEELKVISSNQNLLNKKIIAVYDYESEIFKQLSSNMGALSNKIDDIQEYLKTQGKITQVLSKIILTDDIKLDKLIKKAYGEKLKNSSVSLNKEEKIKKEIKEESNSLIKKYQDLLKELQ